MAQTTQLHAGAITGPPYGDFGGRVPFVPVQRITQLHAGAISGRRYGSFAGRVPVVPTPTPGGGGGGGGRVGGSLRPRPVRKPKPRHIVARGGVVFGPPVIRGRAVARPAVPMVPELVPAGDFADDELAVLAAGAMMFWGD